MTLFELDNYFRSFLEIEEYENDFSLNGIQVQNSDLEGTQIKKIAFSVDASLETIEKAIQKNVQLLFVHHGLFWKRPLTITNIHYERISRLIKNDLALYAVHLPLDAHKDVGNNAQLAKALNIQNIEPFGLYEGKMIGIKGRFSEEVSFDELIQKLKNLGNCPIHTLPFGKKKIKSVGIISGSGGREIAQAITANLDVYITGDIKYENYYEIKDNQMNVITCGHYFSETFGVKAVMKKVNEETDIKAIFIEAPTGM